MNELLNRVILKPYVVKYPTDVILTNVPNSVVETAYKYKIIQQRIGDAWGEVPKLYGWQQGENGVDLMNTTTKQAAEVKNNASTDNSRSRRANFETLLEFKRNHPDYELLYVIINDKSDKDVMKYNNRIRYVSGIHAQRELLGENSPYVIEQMRRKTLEFLENSNLINTNCE